jgi:hypothetical protein
LEGPANVGLFLYDNNTLIAESFLPYHADVKICFAEEVKLIDLQSGARMEDRNSGTSAEFQFKMAPTAYRVFQYQKKA